MWRYGILCLFFFQLITDFVGAVYALGLLGTNIPPEILSVLLLLSPALLLLLRRGPSLRLLTMLQVGVMAAAGLEVLLATRERMLVAGLGLAVFMVLLPSLIWRAGQAGRRDEAVSLGSGLALGLALAILSRSLNSGADPSMQWPYRIGIWLLAAAGGWLLLREREAPAAVAAAADADQPEGPAEPPRFPGTAGLCLGIVAALTLLYFAFASPNVIAAWTGASYLVTVFLVTLALALFAAALALAPDRLAALPPWALLAWNVLFVTSLVATIALRQVAFSPDPAAYPIQQPAPSWPAALPLVLACLLYPVLLLDVMVYSRALLAARPTLRSLGGGFLLAAFFLLVMIFGQVFTTVYDYIPVVGPWFRNGFWAVFLVPGLAVLWPALYLRRDGSWRSLRFSRELAGAVAAACLVAVAGAFILAARPPAAPQGQTALKVLTYNIQQGYSAGGLENYVGQLQVIRAEHPDIVGLQESDTNRISGSNSDIVRYFADRLNMYAYYGPTTVAGTFGIALLSRYPILHPETVYLYSAGEQVAALRAQVVAGGKTFNVVVTHLGNDGPLVQQQALLSWLKDLPDVIAMGDFNFRPDTEQYGLTRAALSEAWLARWPRGVDDEGSQPADRIDYIFLTPTALVTDARYLPPGPSDHPAFVAEIGW